MLTSACLCLDIWIKIRQFIYQIHVFIRRWIARQCLCQRWDGGLSSEIGGSASVWRCDRNRRRDKDTVSHWYAWSCDLGICFSSWKPSSKTDKSSQDRQRRRYRRWNGSPSSGFATEKQKHDKNEHVKVHFFPCNQYLKKLQWIFCSRHIFVFGGNVAFHRMVPRES